MRRVIFNIVFTILALCVVGLAVGIFLFRRDIAITYHRHMMVWDWYRTDRKWSGYTEGFDHHREALTRLGYFNRSEYPLHHIGVLTPEYMGMFRALEHEATNIADAYIGSTNIADANVEFTNFPDAYIGHPNATGAYVRLRARLKIHES